MEQRQRRSRRRAVAIPLDTQVYYWRALMFCSALAGMLVAAFLAARVLAGQLGPTRAVSPPALYSRLKYPVNGNLPRQAPRPSRTHHDPFNARPAELLDLFDVPSSRALADGILAASVPLILVALRFFVLSPLLPTSTAATREGSPKNPRAPPTCYSEAQ